MSLENEVAALTTATTELLTAVNVRKVVLDEKVDAATTQADAATSQAALATTKASEASASATQALAIYGDTAAMNSAVSAAGTSATQAASNAAQSATARDQALTAWASSMAPAETLPIISQSLHVGAIVRGIIYDTEKDSDGGAWRKRCTDKSWFTETLGGSRWIGQQATIAAAWTAAGSAVGAVFQASVTAGPIVAGRYYSANSSTTVTEVFRGISREFPAQAAIVAETGRVVIYDLTQVGCPMWMVFTGIHQASMLYFEVDLSYKSVAALNGKICSAGAYLSVVDFISDSGLFYAVNNLRYFQGGLVSRNLARANPAAFITGPAIAATVLQATSDVAVTVLPNAPIDPATGLPVPTIAVATSGGVSVIRDNGTVVNNTLAIYGAAAATKIMPFKSLGFLVQQQADRARVGLILHGNYAAYVLSYTDASIPTSQPHIPFTPNKPVTSLTGDCLGDGEGFTKLGINPASRGNVMLARVTNTFNTGWQVGDARMAALADTVAESITGPELVTNGTFDVDVSGWQLTSNSISSGGAVEAAGGSLRLTNGTSYSTASTSFATVPGRIYKLTWQKTGGTNTWSPSNQFHVGSFPGGTGIASNIYGVAVGGGTAKFVFVALSTETWISLNSEGSATPGYFVDYDNISVREVVADRSVKNNPLTINGTLTKTAVAAAAQLMGYSGWSATNYLSQPYSANLDFGTGEWSVGAWVNVPVTLPVGSFPLIGPELVTNGGFDTDVAGWVAGGVASIAWDSGRLAVVSGDTTANNSGGFSFSTVVGKTYRLSYSVDGNGGTVRLAIAGLQVLNQAGAVSGQYLFVATATTTQVAVISVNNPVNSRVFADNISVKEAAHASITDLSAPSGSLIAFGVNALGRITATAFDGTTTRTATTTQAYNTGLWNRARVTYTPDGKLAINVNGREVASATGAPLLTMNNSEATLTIGNSRTLDAPFPGSLALLKVSATVPSADQLEYIYRTELAMFQPGAQCTIDGASTAVTALGHDASTDMLHVGTSWGRSAFKDLVRVESEATTVGSITSISASNGKVLMSGTTSGRHYQPALRLREELKRKEEARKAMGKEPVFFDFDTISFTATTTNGSNAITGAASLVGVPYIGMNITGTGIPAGARIAGINGATYYLSANATASGTAVSMMQSSFVLQQGFTAKAVYSAELLKREGTTRAYTRSFDGFRETITFAVAPGNGVWVSIMAIRSN